MLAFAGALPQETVLACTFAGRKCDGLHAEEWIHPSFGTCLTFNGGQRPFRVGDTMYDADSLLPGETMLSYLNERQRRGGLPEFTAQDIANITISSKPLNTRFARAMDALSLYMGVYPGQYLPVADSADELQLDWSDTRLPRSFVFEAAGLRMAVHERKKTPEMDSAIQLHPGLETHLAFTKRVQLNQPSPWGNCSLRFWDNSTNTPADSGNYSLASCELLCAAREIEQRCRCLQLPTPRGFVPQDASMISCWSQGECGDIVEEGVVLGQIACPECVENCAATTFSVKSSSLQWPAEPSAEVIIQRIETLGAGIANGTFDDMSTRSDALEHLRRNVMLARVYPQTSTYETITTLRAYSVTALLSDMGGQAGLWAGVSVLTVGELLELFGLTLLGLCGCKSAFATHSDSEPSSESEEDSATNSKINPSGLPMWDPARADPAGGITVLQSKSGTEIATV